MIDAHVQGLLARGLRSGQSEWIWHKDPWELRPATTAEGGVTTNPHKGKGKAVLVAGRDLEGRMRVGDCVDDEWLVVWLLREVSRRWPEVVIS